MTRTANSGYSRPCISRISAASKRGQDFGKYKPPSLASPASRTSSNSSVGASPRVLMYCTLSSPSDDGLTYPPRRAQASAPQSLQRTSANLTFICRSFCMTASSLDLRTSTSAIQARHAVSATSSAYPILEAAVLRRV